MRWLMRHTTSGDRGAVTVLVTVFIAFGMLGIGAIVIDAGSWYAERAQLQNGSDSAAWKTAAECASSTGCSAQLDSTGRTQSAQGEANDNANDTAAKVDYICGQSPNATANPLLPCDPSTQANDHSCPTAPVLSDGSTPDYVNVHTSTKTPGGVAKVAPFMGKVLLGDSYDGQNIKTCAQVAWGPLGSGTATPFTISYCEWYNATNAGATFADAPPYPPNPPPYPQNKYDPGVLPVAGGEAVLALHGTASTLDGGDFDTAAYGGSGITFGKTPNSPTNGPTLVQPYTSNTSYVHDGDGSLQMTWKPAAIHAESADETNQATTNLRIYVLSAWVKADAASLARAPQVSLYVKNPRTGGGTTFYSPATSLADGLWHQLTYQFTAAGTAVDIGITNATALTSAGAITYIDSVNLRLINHPECDRTPPPNGGGSGFDQSGGFGWLNHAAGKCEVKVSVDNVAWDNTGTALDSDCKSKLQDAMCSYPVTSANPCNRTPLFVPLYNGLCSTSSSTCTLSTACASAGPRPPGANGCYEIVGFAEFVPTGAQLNGAGGLRQGSWINNTRYCKGTNQCIYGFFTHDIVHSISDIEQLVGGDPGIPGAPVLVFAG
jgi:Flp pilus assembly protein TadG